MQQEYVEPQLNLVGEVDRVVLGGLFGGGDLSGELIHSGGDFLADDASDSVE
jgi:hypothetical protein